MGLPDDNEPANVLRVCAREGAGLEQRGSLAESPVVSCSYRHLTSQLREKHSAKLEMTRHGVQCTHCCIDTFATPGALSHHSNCSPIIQFGTSCEECWTRNNGPLLVNIKQPLAATFFDNPFSHSLVSFKDAVPNDRPCSATEATVKCVSQGWRRRAWSRWTRRQPNH